MIAFYSRIGVGILALTSVIAHANGPAIKCTYPTKANATFEIVLRHSADASRGLIEDVLQDANLPACLEYSDGTHSCLIEVPAIKGPALGIARDIRNTLEQSSVLAEDTGLIEGVFPNAPIELDADDEFWPRDALFEPNQRELRDLGAPFAWSRVSDASCVVTAVIDSGVQLDHPDLKPNLLPGFGVPRSELPHDGSPDGSIGHGTRMAGLIAAVANNGTEGIAGTAWNTRMLPIRFTRKRKSNDNRGGEAIDEAVKQRVAIINASWSSACELPLVFAALKRAEGEGVLVIASAGKGGHDIDNGAPVYPATYARTLNNVVTVMSHDQYGKPSANSNWGRLTVDLAAPGDGWSTKICEGDDCYDGAPDSSTSAATAYVSGAAALLKSAAPRWTPPMLKAHILSTVVLEPELLSKTRSGGRLNLKRLMRPVSFTLPGPGEKWPREQAKTIMWMSHFGIGLCSSLELATEREGMGPSHPVVITANDGVERVTPPNLPVGSRFRYRLRCPDTELWGATEWIEVGKQRKLNRN